MIIHFAKDHDKFALNIFGALNAVVVLSSAESAAMNVGSEVAYSGTDTWVKGAAIGEMAAKAHALRASVHSRRNSVGQDLGEGIRAVTYRSHQHGHYTSLVPTMRRYSRLHLHHMPRQSW
jgi:hypothetical protein